LAHDVDDDEDTSALRCPAPRGPTDSGTTTTTTTPVGGGGTRHGPGSLVKRLKNKVKFGSQIALTFGKKKETIMESDQQNFGIPIQETIWLARK
jgi:hypothetical protein